MDPLLLLSLAIILAAILFVISQVMKLSKNEGDAKRRLEQALVADQDQRRGPRIVGGQRRAAGAGAARRRPGRRGGADDSDDDVDMPAARGGIAPPEWAMDDDMDEEGDFAVDAEGKKVGKKKMAKLQAKEEKKMMREEELREREERKRREAQKEEERKRDQQKREKEDKEEEERIRLEKEEKERREHEEYLKLKESFAVEEEGFDENETLESENLLQDFINYVKQMKVVNMDELASHFKLKTADVVERVRTLVADGTLTGVIDDRGKFIYISMEELHSVAKFINQRGRVSVQELAEYSNTLIKLESGVQEVPVEE